MILKQPATNPAKKVQKPAKTAKRTKLYNSNISKVFLKNRIDIFSKKAKEQGINLTLTHMKVIMYTMLNGDFSSKYMLCTLTNPDIKTHTFETLINHFYKLRCYPMKSENIAFLTLKYGAQGAKDYLKRKGDRVRGSNNPGFQHGGKLSPFSKNFVKGDITEQTKKKAQQTRKEHPERQQTKIEYYLLKTDGDMEKAIEMLKERQAVGRLSKFIERYGEVEGKKRWEERQEKWMNTLNSKSPEEMADINRRKIWKKGCQSSLEKDIFENLHSHISELKQQLYLSNSFSSWYVYDLYYKNKIIEIHGDFWHGNPIKYKENDLMYGGKTASEIWARDDDKIETAKKAGYEVKVVWESEYNNNKQQILKECIEFLRQ